jgi:hypothetical protein
MIVNFVFSNSFVYFFYSDFDYLLTNFSDRVSAQWVTVVGDISVVFMVALQAWLARLAWLARVVFIFMVACYFKTATPTRMRY